MNAKPNLKRIKKLRPTKKSLEKRAAKVEKTTVRHARKFLLNRWDNLRDARRHVIGWLLLVAVLIAVGVLQMVSYSSGYRTEASVSGGTYAEGVVGKIVNINPLYAETDAEQAASKLVYDSLFSYDQTNNLRGDLATKWTMNEDGTIYDIELRKNTKWHDGQPVTADDVIFTVNTIRDPRVGSVLYDSWRTINVEKVSDTAVRFVLSSPFTPFPHALTFGVLPKHLLGDIQPEQFREYVSGTRAIGAGPYTFRNSSVTPDGQAVIYLNANESYYRRAPRIATIQLRTYADSETLARGFSTGEVNAAVGLSVDDAVTTYDHVGSSRFTQVPLNDGVFALFNTTAATVNNKDVRLALRQGLDREAVRDAVVVDDAKDPQPLNGPIAQGIYKSVDELTQPVNDTKAAAAKLDELGWVKGEDGIRAKEDQKLKLSVVTVQDTDYEPAAREIVRQWRDLGIEIDLTVASPENVQQNYFIPRNYDVLIYQLSLGADPDVFAYWHSSQASARGLNFANYKSSLADTLLVSGRTRTSAELREAKYVSFVETWLEDAPAIALYKPDLYYLTANDIESLDGSSLVNVTYRFRDVYNWTARIGAVDDTP